jgi:hypothetical protein
LSTDFVGHYRAHNYDLERYTILFRTLLRDGLPGATRTRAFRTLIGLFCFAIKPVNNSILSRLFDIFLHRFSDEHGKFVHDRLQLRNTLDVIRRVPISWLSPHAELLIDAIIKTWCYQVIPLLRASGLDNLPEIDASLGRLSRLPKTPSVRSLSSP